MSRHVVMASGGIGSWCAARRVATEHGTADLVLLFTDTLGEDGDLYRVLIEGSAWLLGLDRPLELLRLAAELPPVRKERERVQALAALRAGAAELLPGLTWLAEGRTIWDVFRDERFLGNSRVDPCSKILKREMADRWLAANCDPAETVIHVGIDWSEAHRFERLRDRRAPISASLIFGGGLWIGMMIERSQRNRPKPRFGAPYDKPISREEKPQ